MWIVRLALDRPYTFIVLAILILIAAPVVILRTPTDIFPSIDIPVVSVAWQYTGLSPEELEGRLTTPYEKALTTLVDNIQHIESTTLQRPGDRQDLSAAGRLARYRQRAGLRRLRSSCCASSRRASCRRRSSTSRPPRVPILQLGAFRQRPLRAAAERLRPELHPPAARHHPRRRRAQRLWRQAALDHGQP